MADGKVTIQVENNARQASRDFDRLDKELKDVAKSADKADDEFGSLRGALGAVGGVIATIGVAQLSRSLVTVASDAEETANKFRVVFSELQVGANQAVKELTENFGLARTEARGLLSDTGDLLTGFGFTQEQALGLSEQVNQLAVDLASFQNVEGGAERASRALTSALLGEREAVKSLGIVITEADLKRLAEDRGIVGELTRQQKAVLTLESALSQSKNAIGDFSRSSESYANQARIAESAVQDLSEAIGKRLIPSATTGLGVFTKFVRALEDFIDPSEGLRKEIVETSIVIEELKNQIRTGDVGFFDGIFGASAEKRLEFFNEKLADLKKRAQDIGAIPTSDINATASVDTKSGSKSVNDLSASLEALRSSAGGFDVGIARTTDADFDVFLDNIKRADDEFKALKDGAIEDLGRGLSNALTTPFREGETAVQRFGNLALSIISQVAQELLTKQLIGLFAGGATGGVDANAKGGVFNNGSKVQAFANGGVVSSPTFFPMANGGTGLMGEAGAEAIMPLRRGSGGRLGVDASNVSPTVNVFNQSDVSIETVVRPDNEVDVFVRRVNGVLASERSQGAFSTALSRQRQSGIQGA